jgi:hypothetical protein
MSCLTLFLHAAVKFLMLLMLITFEDTLLLILVKISILSKAILLFPHNGKASLFLTNRLALVP